MAQYVLIDTKSRKVLGIFIIVGIALFVVGILIGYFSGKSGTDDNSSGRAGGNQGSGSVADAIRASCSADIANPADAADNTYFRRYLQRHDDHNACVDSLADCWDFGLPRNYIAYHLNEKTINVDGKLDDDAWEEVYILFY